MRPLKTIPPSPFYPFLLHIIIHTTDSSKFCIVSDLARKFRGRRRRRSNFDYQISRGNRAAYLTYTLRIPFSSKLSTRWLAYVYNTPLRHPDLWMETLTHRERERKLDDGERAYKKACYPWGVHERSEDTRKKRGGSKRSIWSEIEKLDEKVCMPEVWRNLRTIIVSSERYASS